MVDQVEKLLVVVAIIACACVGVWIYSIFKYNWDNWEEDRKKDQEFL
jgi:hypothetical protein